MINELDPIYRYPLTQQYPVTQTFDQHLERAKQYPPGRYNGGIDYGCKIGTPVLATLPGRVTACGASNTGYGTYVKLDHGYIDDVHIESIYGHLSEMLLNVNAWVDDGAQIGISGNTGNSTGPHLHFEIRHDSIPVDPDLLLDQTTAPEQADDPLPLPSIIDQVRILKPMNLRSDTMVDPDTIIGRLDWGAIVDVADEIVDGKDTWLMVVGYVAADYDGVRYVEVIDD